MSYIEVCMSYSVPKPEGEAARAEGHYNHRHL